MNDSHKAEFQELTFLYLSKCCHHCHGINSYPPRFYQLQFVELAQKVINAKRYKDGTNKE